MVTPGSMHTASTLSCSATPSLSASDPLCFFVCLFFVLTRIVTKEVTQCILECHSKVLALFIVQQVLSPFVQTRKAILSTGYCAQALMVPATRPYLSPPSFCWSYPTFWITIPIWSSNVYPKLNFGTEFSFIFPVDPPEYPSDTFDSPYTKISPSPIDLQKKLVTLTSLLLLTIPWIPQSPGR